MKKSFIIACLCTICGTQAHAESNIFNHLGAGLEVGTTGIGFEVAAPITDYVQVRAGMAIMPSFKVKDIKVNVNVDDRQWSELQTVTGYQGDRPTNVKLDTKVTKADFKLLFDVFPFRKSSFHVTAGFYAGKSQLLDVYTTNNADAFQAITEYNEMVDATDQIGVQVGDYLLTPNGERVRGFVKVKGFKPYVGFGFGRAIPKKTRLAFAFDLGVQFWSTPKFFIEQQQGQVEVTKQDVGNDDGGFVKTMSKITVYPCLNFRLTGRIF
ncbi:MAG: hypothetical protein J6W24_00410 [Prevotella sp.]|jgi:hypothetical protein|nr:hypothetical protein [Prevotella sp.]